MLVFQMGARPDAFVTEFDALLTAAPLSGPVVLTHSRFDRANCLWHRFVEGGPGIGCVGATGPSELLRNGRLKDVGETYADADLGAPIVNLDASWLYRRGRCRLDGAHSDIWYDASAHLLLSLADQARWRARPAAARGRSDRDQPLD